MYPSLAHSSVYTGLKHFLKKNAMIKPNGNERACSRYIETKKMLLFVFLVSFKSKLSQVDLCSLQTHLELACNKRLRHSSKEEYQLYRETGTVENTLKVAGRQVGNVSL